MTKSQKIIDLKPEPSIPKSVLQKNYWEKIIVSLMNETVMVTNTRDKKVPYYVAEVYQVYENHAVFRYKVYDVLGNERGYQFISVNYNSLICGDDKVVGLDERARPI